MYRESSSTTPLHPVFDGSSKAGRNKSINDCLYKGPNLLDLLPSFILRFREKRVAFYADIRKAFLMINVAKNDRVFLRFLWLTDDERIIELQHHRVVFGLNCSPYLLNAVIKHHLSQWSGDEEIIDVLKKSFYIDNLLGSVESMQAFSSFKEISMKILYDAQMKLHEWANSSDEDSQSVKILGMTWLIESDTITLTKLQFPDEIPLTRHSLSSIVQKIFDPLGFFSPVLMIPKICIQESWRNSKDWDAILPEDVYQRCKRWFAEIDCLWTMRIERHLHFDEGLVQLHVFTDASERGYAAVIYARIISETIQLSFVQARA